MLGALGVPSLYELETVDSVPCLIEHARALAMKGAEEGTLVLAGEQTRAKSRRGQPWEAPQGNLYCALVTRPEYPLSNATQLAYVAALSLGKALAELLEPTTLRYRWPDNILLNDAKAALVLLDAQSAAGGRCEWLNIVVAVNVGCHPGLSLSPASSVHASGSPNVSVTQILEGYTRHFLSNINRWAEFGFEPVRKAWIQRADLVDEEVVLSVGDADIEGRFKGVGAHGDLLFECANTERRVSVGEFYGLCPTQ